MKILHILTNEQIAKVIDQIDTPSDQWDQRDAHQPFFTLGATNYLDSSKVNNKRYYDKVKRLNPINPILIGKKRLFFLSRRFWKTDIKGS